jgi:uncharacterized protein
MTLRSALKSFTRLSAGVVLGLGIYGAVAFDAAPAYAQAALAPQAPAAEAAPAIRPAEGSGPRLWVIRDEDSTLYLFGTVHVLKPETGWGTPRFQAAFDASDELWLEFADIDDTAGVVAVMQRHGLSPERPLSSVLNADQIARVDAAARTLGASAAQMDGMRPWMAAITLAMAPLAKAGFDPQSGVELTLARMARAQGKTIKGFETPDKQVGLIAGMSEEAQVQLLDSTLDDFDNAAAELNQMVAAWAAGDIDTLDAVMVEKVKDKSPEAYDVMLTRRNADWADQIEDLLKGSGTAFIAVGAGHLAGEDSVQAMLTARGVTVEEVRE